MLRSAATDVNWKQDVVNAQQMGYGLVPYNVVEAILRHLWHPIEREFLRSDVVVADPAPILDELTKQGSTGGRKHVTTLWA